LSTKKTTFVFGTGAVENSWTPVIKALNKTYDINTDSDGANFLMARDVHLLRTYSTFAKRDHYPEVFDITKSNVANLKQNIASELQKAQEAGEIEARPALQAVIEKFAGTRNDKIGIVTTNWDKVIDHAINKLFRWGKHGSPSDIICYHLHGSISDPNMLFLPSETTMEPYRTTAEENIIGKHHRSFMRLIQNSNRTVLYGLSLDPLDAELNVSLASAWQSPTMEEVVIINPDHHKVAKRVKLLLDKNTFVKVSGYHPGDLNERIGYE